MAITYTDTLPTALHELVHLYENVGWRAYTQDRARLIRAIQQSQYVLLARDQQKIVGLIRTVGDGETIVYIQDLLVHTAYQRRGIGTALMRQTLDRFQHCRQQVLLTDEQPETRSFYEALGFQSCDQGKVVAFVKWVHAEQG